MFPLPQSEAPVLNNRYRPEDGTCNTHDLLLSLESKKGLPPLRRRHRRSSSPPFTGRVLRGATRRGVPTRLIHQFVVAGNAGPEGRRLSAHRRLLMAVSTRSAIWDIFPNLSLWRLTGAKKLCSVAVLVGRAAYSPPPQTRDAGYANVAPWISRRSSGVGSSR